MSNRETSIQQLTALKEKLSRVSAVNKAIADLNLAAAKEPSYIPLSKKELLPVDNAENYLRSKVPSRLDVGDRKALIVKVIFWAVAILAVLITGFVIGKSIYEAGVYEPLICPAALIVSIVVGYLDVKRDWDRKMLILAICIMVAIAMAVQTHKYFGFSFWIFFGVVAVSAGLVVLCMHFDGWSDFFYHHNKKIDKQEQMIRQTKEYQSMADLDHRNGVENNRTETVHREAHKQRIKEREKQLDQKIEEYRKEKESLDREIDRNGILSSKDYPKIDRILEKLTNYRSDTIKEALQLCDAEDAEMARYQMERADKQLQESLNRLERDRKIQQESDAYFNQTMHNMRMEKEQRRQTEELERIRKELEK